MEMQPVRRYEKYGKFKSHQNNVGHVSISPLLKPMSNITGQPCRDSETLLG